MTESFDLLVRRDCFAQTRWAPFTSGSGSGSGASQVLDAGDVLLRVERFLQQDGHGRTP